VRSDGSVRHGRPLTPGHFLTDSAIGPAGRLASATAHRGVGAADTGPAADVPRLNLPGRAPRGRPEFAGDSEAPVPFTSTPMSKDYAASFRVAAESRRSRRVSSVATQRDAARAELLRLAQAREEMAAELRQVSAEIARLTASMEMSELLRVKSARQSLRRPPIPVANKVGDRSNDADWHDPRHAHPVNAASTLQSLCATCGFSYGEHVVRSATLMRRRDSVRPSTAHRTDVGNVVASAVPLARPRSAAPRRVGPALARPVSARATSRPASRCEPSMAESTESRAMTSSRHGRQRLPASAPRRPLTAGSHRPTTRRHGFRIESDGGLVNDSSELGIGSSRRVPHDLGHVAAGDDTERFSGKQAATLNFAGGADVRTTTSVEALIDAADYAPLYDVADGDILALEDEILNKPVGAVCDAFVPGCMGPAPIFRAQARVREADSRKSQFVNAYNTTHTNAFSLFGKQRGWS